MRPSRPIPFLFLLLLLLGLAACGDDTKTVLDADASGSDVADDTVTDTLPDAGEDPVDDVEGDVEADVLADADAGTPEGYPIEEPGPITNLVIDGLEDPVELKYDDDGIPSISCQSDEDCAAVLGYVHARDRFAQMDIRRRLVRGRISEIVVAPDDLALGIDVSSRTLYSTPDGRPIEEVLLENTNERTQGLLEAYANGVNAWIDDLTNRRNGASLPLEYGFSLLVLPEPMTLWEPEDSLASVAALVGSLTNAASSDISYGEQFANIQADEDYDLSVFADYFRPWPFGMSTIIDDYVYPAPEEKAGGSLLEAGLNLAEHARAMTEARTMLEQIDAILGVAEDRGSNNWVLGPSTTADDIALFTNDPHLGFSNPSVWYIAHMDAKTNGEGDNHVAGLTFAGLPFVIIGQNEDIAWGATNTSFDFSDVYLEELTEDGEGVVFGDTEVDFVEVEHTYPQAIGAAVVRTSLFVPHHGPVLSIDREAGTAVTLRWTGNLMTTDGNFLADMMRATTVTEARTALRQVTSIGQNWVVIDTAGNFGWFPYNEVPNRPWASAAQPAFMPLDGSSDETEWDGAIAYEDLPQTYNRDEGYLATANNDMTGANLDGDPTNDGHPLLQSTVATGYRHERIVDLIEASTEHTTATLLDIVGDTYSIVGEVVSPELLEVTRDDLSTNAQALYDAIDNWELTCPTGLTGSDPTGDAVSDGTELAESLGCAAFHRVFSDAFRGWAGDERAVKEWARSPSTDSFLRALLRTDDLTQPDLFWDDITTEDVTETQAEILTAAFEAAADNFEALVGDDPTDWHWGRVHTMTMRADLFSSLGVPSYDEGPFARAGGLYAVNVANPPVGADHLNVRSGPSMRLICAAPEAGVTCSVQLPGGEPHFRVSDEYLGLFERWQSLTPREVTFDHDGLDAPAIPGNPPPE